jgi:hypothetical protein
MGLFAGGRMVYNVFPEFRRVDRGIGLGRVTPTIGNAAKV